MKHLLNYQYERDYIHQAKINDQIFQDKKQKQRLNLISKNNWNETMTSKKRSETNHRKLKIINENVKSTEL
jgi:hypothetical protein